MGQGYGVSRPTRSSGSPDSWIDQCSIHLERKLFITLMSLRTVDQFPIGDLTLAIRPRLASHEDMKMDLVGISVSRTDKCGEKSNHGSDWGLWSGL